MDTLPGRCEVSMEAERIGCPWYVLQVRTRYENAVASQLHGRGYASFLPVYKTRRRWSDRFKESELPLFPGYVFCQINLLDRLPVLTIPGVVCVVGVGRTPVAVDETEFAAILAAVKSGLPKEPWPFLQTGQRVRVEYGPLCGNEGILLGFKGHHRLVLSVTILQRSVAVEVDDAWVIPIPQLPRTGKSPASLSAP